MSRTDRFNSPAEVERLADMKRSVDLVALATQRYNMMITDKGRNGEGVELRNSPNGDGPRITVKTGPEGYQIYNNHNDSRDKGTVVDFLQQRHPERNLGQVKGMLQEMIPGARQALQIEQQQDQLNRKGVSADEARYNDLPPTDRRAVMVNETTGNRGQRGQPPLAITDSSYLVSRGLSLDTLADPAFENRVFNDQLKSRTDRASGAPHNTAFPFYNSGGIQSFELRNFPAPGKTESWKGGMSNPEDGQNSKNGVWSSNLTQGRNVQAGQLIIGESPIDMMSKFQLEKEGRAPGQEADNVRYVATGGPASVAQKAILQDLIDRDQPRQITLANDNDAAGKAFNIRYLNDLRAPQNGLDEQQKQQSNEAAAAVSWSVTTNGKRGEERAFAMTIELVTTSSGQGRELMEGIREQARRLGLPTESPELAGGVGFDQRTNKGPESSLVLRVPEAQAPELLALAYELREARERSLPEVARTPANYFVVETATGKDYNQDVQQGRYDAQLAEQRREAGLSQGSVVAPEASPVTAQVVPGAVPEAVPEVVLERAQIRVIENEPLPDGVQARSNLGPRALSEEIRQNLERSGLEVTSSPVPGTEGPQTRTYLEFAYEPNSNKAVDAAEILGDAMKNAAGRISVVGIAPVETGYDQYMGAGQLPTSYAPVALVAEQDADVLRARLTGAGLSVTSTEVEGQPGILVLLRPEYAREAAVLERVLDLHETETGRPVTVLQSELTASSRERDVNTYYGETNGPDRLPPAITGRLEIEDNGYPSREGDSLLDRLERVGATVNSSEQEPQGPQGVDGIRPLFVIEYPLDQPAVAANVDRLVQEGLREKEFTMEAENGFVLAGREALRKREGDAGVDLELVGRTPETVAEIKAGRDEAIAQQTPFVPVITDFSELQDRLMGDARNDSSKLGYPGVATAAVGYPGTEDFYKQQLVEAGATLIERPVTELAPAGTQSLSYPLNEPEVVARVSVVLDEIDAAAKARTANVGAEAGPVGVYEDPAYRVTRQQAAVDYAPEQVQRAPQNGVENEREPSLSELRVAVVEERQLVTPQIAADIDLNGSTSAEEIIRADRNRDGVVSGTELEAARFDARQGQEQQTAQGPVAADIDNNGSTSQAEILRADANRDGIVTGTELNAARFETKQTEQEPILAAELTAAERMAEIRRVYEAQRIAIEAERLKTDTERRDEGLARGEGRAVDAPLQSAGIIVTEAEPLPAGTLGPQSLTLLQLSEQMREALEPLSSGPVTGNVYRDKATDTPAVLLSFSYYADTPQHAALQQVLRDGAELGGVKAFGIKAGEEPAREVAREPALFARVIALNEQPLAIAQETPSLLLQSQLGATGARVTAEPVQERPGLVVVVDTFKGEQLAGVAQILAQLPASSLVVESPEAQQTRQQSTQDFRQANGVAPALTTEALLNDPRESDVAERLRTAGAVVVPVAPAIRPELPQGGLSVVYSLEKPEIISRVSVVLDDVNARGLQLAIDLGKNPTLAKGVVVESELAQQTRQQVAKDNGIEAIVLRQMPLAQPSVDVPLARPQSVVIADEATLPGKTASAEPVRVSVAEPVPSAIERRLTLEINDTARMSAPGVALVLEDRLKNGGFEVKPPNPQAAGQEEGISRVEVLYRTTDPAVLRVLQQAELQKMVKMEGVTFVEPAGQAQERLDATKSVRPEMGADGKVDASKMSKAGQVLQISVMVHEPEGDAKRTDKLWTDLRKEGGQMVNISKVDLGAQGAQFSFKADFAPGDSRLLAASAILEAAGRSEGIQIQETTNARRERLSRADLLENKARLALPAEQQHTHVKKTAAEYPVALPESFERVALSSAALKTEAGMKELRAELKQSGANVAVQQVDGQPANSGIVQLSFLREQPKAEALNAVLEKFTENGGAVYDLKAGRDRNAAPELSVAPVALTDREANTLETRSLEARKEQLAKELKAESDRAALAEMQHLPAVVLAPVVGAPGVEQEPVKPWAGTGHDLRAENLRDTDMERIDLRGANLAGQDLRSASLLGSDLRGANLSDTDLRGVDLTGVRLEDALLTGAQLDKAYRVVEGPDGRRSMEDNLTAAQLTAPETAAERAERGPLSVPAERTLNTGLSAEENGAASAPRIAMLQAPQYAGLDLPTEEELRLRTQPVPTGPEASLPPRMSLPTEEGMKIAEISNQPAVSTPGVPTPELVVPELVAPVIPTPEVPAQERAERAPSPLSAYEQLHEKGTEYHLAEIYVTQPLGTEAALAASAALGQATETDRTSAVLERLTAAGAEVRRETGALPDENGKTETSALSVVYTHDDRQLPAIHQVLLEVASPTVDGYGVRVTDEEAAARAATVGSRLENTQEAAKGLAVQLHDGDVSTARVLVERPSLEDVLALQGAGASVERIYLPEGPAAVVSYPANEAGVTGLVSIELDRIARDSSHSRPPHNSLEHEISGPLVGEDPAQQQRRQALATTEGLVLEPRPRYELNEMAERDTRAKEYFQQETARPSEALGGQLANGEPFTGGLREAIRLEQADREAVETSWKSGRTTMILTVLETPELSSGDGSHYAPYPDKVAAALQKAGAETEVTAMGVSKDTGLDRHLISVSFENNSPELARIQQTLNRLAEQDGVLVPVEGFWQRERVLGPNGSHGAEPVLAERERPWLEAVSAILEPTAQERRELTRAGARLEDTVFEGKEDKAAVRVFYDLDNPLMVGRISPILDRATEDGRGMGEVSGVREARQGRAEQAQQDIAQGKEIGGERTQPETEKNVNLSFMDKFRAAVDYQLEEIRSGWEKGSPENLKIAFAEQKGRQDRENADQIAAEKAAYDRGYKGAETPAPVVAEVAVAAVLVEAVTAEKAALAGNVMASATSGMVGGTAGSAAEASGEKVLRERRDDERTVPIVMDAPKEGKILEVREQLTPATAGVSDREKKDGEQTPPPVPPVIAVAQATVVALTPERELQHGIISMEGSKSHTADERIGMVSESMVAAGAQVGAIIPSTRDHSEASLPYAFDPRGAHLATVNVVLHDVHTAQPSRVVEEPHSQRFAGIVANTHEIPKQDWPEREGQFAKAHIIIDDADHKGEARAGRVREAFGGGGVVVSEAKKDGHGHVEMDVSYHTHSPNIEKINNTLDKAGNTAGIEVQESSVDRSARYQGANDLQAAKSKDQERERGD